MVLAREISVEESTMGGGAEWACVHAACVAYVAALSGGGADAGAGGAAAGGVWREHSYARATRRPARHAPRTLLAPATDSDDQDSAPLDVGSEAGDAGPALPALPCDAHDDDDDDTGADGGDDEWEGRVAALAPSAAHARLAACAADILREMRLARLASAGAGRALRREQARAAASKLRRALAPTWLWSGAGGGSGGGGGGGGGGAAWLYSVLSAYLPRPLRALLEEALDELRRAAPRLAARLPAPRRAPPSDPLSPSETTIPVPLSTGGPLLVWVSAGREGADARWARRLGALLPTRTVPPAGGGAGGRAPPDVWCAQQAAAARVALNDVLAEAGSRPVFLAGFSAGAALCCALAAGLGGGGAGGAGAGGGAARGAVRGVALLAPPLVSAEGEESLDIKMPLLIIAGSSAGGAGGGRVGALDACAGGTGGGGAGAGAEARRLVAVWGADDALRLPARLLRRARLPRQALDAAIVEEVVRWARELVDADADADDDQSGTTESAGEVIDVDDEEYAHLPSPWSPPAPAPAPAPPARPADTPAAATPPALNNNIHLPQPVLGTPPGAARAIEIVEGRVVSRVSGSTPLLLTPRRATPAPAPAAPPPAPADIMKMPIVFADDEPPALPTAPEAPSPVEAPLTVTSGAGRGGSALKYTRVIVAKRGAGAGGVPPGRAVPAPRAPPPAPPEGPRGVTVRGGTRPVLLRRAVRVMGRVRRPQKEQ